MDLIFQIATKKAKDKYKELGISEELLSIYLKNKKLRTNQENLYLMQSFEQFDCFQKILKENKEGELMLETIIKNLDFVIYDPRKEIYSPNEIISNMFYIFYGTVKVYKNKIEKMQTFGSPLRRAKTKTYNIKMSPIKEEVKERSEFKKLGFVIKMIDAMKKSLIKKESDIKKIKLKENEYILSKGDEYGFEEIKEKRRKDSVMTVSSCVIGFLSKEDWQYVFEKTNVIKRNDLMKFLEGLKVLKNRKNDKIVKNLFGCINERAINIGETLINIGEEVKYFYIIRKGFFQVEVRIKEKISNIFNDLDLFGNYNHKEKTENIKYEAKNYYTKEENFKIITYGRGEFLGDIEFCLNSKKYLTKIVCKSSKSVVYEIKYEDLINYMTPTLKETLIKEGGEKLEYFKKRIKEMKIIKSTKFSNKNKYKQIILDKLEEEKGEIFTNIENKKSGLYLYELKRRKRLKTASLRKNIKDIYSNNDLIKDKYNYNNNIYLSSIKQNRSKVQNNYLSLYDKNDNKHIFPSSVKNNKTNIKLFQNNFILYNKNTFNKFNSKEPSSKKWDNIINNSLILNNQTKSIQKINEKTYSTLFNSIPNKKVNINNIEIKNKINNIQKNSNKNNNIKTITLPQSSKRDIMRILLNRKFHPKTPNDKILKAYSLLCNTESNIKKHLKTNNTIEINGINYYNTQEYSFLKTNDKSLNENDSNNNIIHILKKNKNFFISKKGIPLLTEFISNEKKSNLKGFYLQNNKNYNVNY